MALTFREYLIVTEAFQEAEGTTLTEGEIWDKIKAKIGKISKDETPAELAARLKKEFDDRKAKAPAKQKT